MSFCFFFFFISSLLHLWSRTITLKCHRKRDPWDDPIGFTCKGHGSLPRHDWTLLRSGPLLQIALLLTKDFSGNLCVHRERENWKPCDTGQGWGVERVQTQMFPKWLPPIFSLHASYTSTLLSEFVKYSPPGMLVSVYLCQINLGYSTWILKFSNNTKLLDQWSVVGEQDLASKEIICVLT